MRPPTAPGSTYDRAWASSTASYRWRSRRSAVTLTALLPECPAWASAEAASCSIMADAATRGVLSSVLSTPRVSWGADTNRVSRQSSAACLTCSTSYLERSFYCEDASGFERPLWRHPADLHKLSIEGERQIQGVRGIADLLRSLVSSQSCYSTDALQQFKQAVTACYWACF